jgi:hypothetical protein
LPLPPSVTPLVDALLADVVGALGDNFVGLYLTGSLALGGFDPETSDVDILVVTGEPLSDAEFAEVRVLHDRIPPDANRYEIPYDVTYIDRATLRRFAPGRRHVKIGHSEPLHHGDHRPNWVLERWTVRDHGVIVAGPDPKTLIDPVSPEELCQAVRDELRHRLRSWTEGLWPLAELEVRAAQAFEVETACRALHTLRSGAPGTKNEAQHWALRNLPERWHDLIRWAGQHRADALRDNTLTNEALAFLHWAVSEADIPSNPAQTAHRIQSTQRRRDAI